jgi:hypothetical protein
MIGAYSLRKSMSVSYNGHQDTKGETHPIPGAHVSFWRSMVDSEINCTVSRGAGRISVGVSHGPLKHRLIVGLGRVRVQRVVTSMLNWLRVSRTSELRHTDVELVDTGAVASPA